MTKAKQQALIARRIQKAVVGICLPFQSLTTVDRELRAAIQIGKSDDELRAIAKSYSKRNLGDDEIIEPEDQSQGDILGLDDERAEP